MYDHVKVDAEYARMDAAGERASTIASAIEINRPVNLSKCLRALHGMDGVVRSVDDRCILEHKALVGRYGFGCEPASAASVAGARRLREDGRDPRPTKPWCAC
jgi:threonine synthase